MLGYGKVEMFFINWFSQKIQCWEGMGKLKCFLIKSI